GFAHVLNEFRVKPRFRALCLIRLRPRNVNEADLRKSLLLRVEERGEFINARVRHFDDADVRFLFRAVSADLCRKARERVKYGRLARPGKTYKSYFHYSPLLLIYNCQIFPCHLRGLWQAEKSQHRGRNIFQRPAFAQAAPIIAYQNYRHRVRRVRSEYLSRHRINHLLGVAVIGGDYHNPATRANRVNHSPQVPVNHFNRFYRRLELPRVTYHIGVGIVHNHHFKFAALYLPYHFVGDRIGAHLRHQIVSRDLRRRNQYALLAGELRFHAAVEKESHVRVLFSRGYAKISEARRRENIGQYLVVMFGLERNGQRECVIVLSHAGEANAGTFTAIEAREILFGEC